MIESLGDKATADLFNGTNSRDARSIPKSVWSVARRKLDMLHAAASTEDLKVPPSNHLEKLQGDLAGFYSIRVNDQYRVVFRWDAPNAKDVRVVDCH